MHRDNHPVFGAADKGVYEVWYLKLNLPLGGPAFWFRFTTLAQKRGIKKVAETWAMVFTPDTNGAASKLALKNTFAHQEFGFLLDETIRVKDSVFGKDGTRGAVVARGHSVEWELSFEPNDFTFFHVPATLQKLGIAKSMVCKPNVDLRFNGWVSVDGKRYEVKNAPGCQGHIWGKKYPAEWVWAHCNMFEGSPDTVFEGLSARVKLGGVIKSPKLSAIFFQYKGQRYEFNRLSDSIFIASDYALTRWVFSAERGRLRLQGEINCDTKDMLAVTYENTDGSYMFCNNTELASMQLSVYIDGKLDAALKSTQTTAFEMVNPNKSAYVEVLL